MIIVVGDFIQDVDLFFKTIGKSPEGDWPVVKYSGTKQRTGGAGAVLAMVRALGEPAIGIGEFAKQNCVKRRHFIDEHQVFREDLDDTTAIKRATAARLVEQIPDNALVLVADYAKGIVTDELWSLLRTKKVIVDPSRNRSLDFYRGAFGIVPNRHEAKVKSVDEALGMCSLLRDHFEHVCIKLDRDGMVTEGCHIPAHCSQVVDVCGAGDMVLAAIGVGLVRGMSWKHACEFANSMAGRKCQQHGATPVESGTGAEWSPSDEPSTACMVVDYTECEPL